MELLKWLHLHFYQIYTIFVYSKEWKIPVVRALLGEKTEEIHQKNFVILRQKIQEISGISFMPENIITDYETGFIQANRKIFFVS